MIQVPAFRSNLQATFLHRDRALLSSSQQQIMIEGELCGRVAARIDGCSTALEIVNSMGAEPDPLEVLHALVQMEEKGLLMEAESDLSAEEAAFWRRLDIAPRDAAARLRQSQVDVITLGNAANIEQELAASLEKSGLTRQPDAPFAMVIADNFLDSRLRNLNREFQLRKTSWMLLKPTGAARIGPLFHPETACWECLAARFRESCHIGYCLSRADPCLDRQSGRGRSRQMDRAPKKQS
jgi:oxazoline/thiazoline synthase